MSKTYDELLELVLEYSQTKTVEESVNIGETLKNASEISASIRQKQSSELLIDTLFKDMKDRMWNALKSGDIETGTKVIRELMSFGQKLITALSSEASKYLQDFDVRSAQRLTTRLDKYKQSVSKSIESMESVLSGQYKTNPKKILSAARKLAYALSINSSWIVSDIHSTYLPKKFRSDEIYSKRVNNLMNLRNKISSMDDESLTDSLKIQYILAMIQVERLGVRVDV